MAGAGDVMARRERLKRVKELGGVAHVTVQRWVRWYEAGGLEEVRRHWSGSGVKSYEAWTPAQEAKVTGSGVGRTVSDDRRGDGLM